MSFNEYNLKVIKGFLAEIDQYRSGNSTLEDLQYALSNAESLVENDGSGVRDKLRRAEADLESILFGTLLSEQRDEAIRILDELLVDCSTGPKE